MLREGLLDRTNTSKSVWADTAYRSNANEVFMDSRCNTALTEAPSEPLPPTGSFVAFQIL